jgi:hypothetical protein
MVAQVNEQKVAVVTLTVNPARQTNFRICVSRAQRITIV